MAAQALEARAAALQAVAEHWVKEMLPEHFKSGAERKYGYAKRTEAHLKRKRREGRGQDPNVYTGRLREKMMGMEPRITVNRRGVTLVWPGLPRYAFVVDTMEFVKSDGRWDDETFAKIRRAQPDPAKAEKAIAGILRWRKEHPQEANGKFKKIKRPDKVKEITAMNRADADALGKVFKDTLQEKLRAR
jgi:hypothetical protein